MPPDNQDPGPSPGLARFRDASRRVAAGAHMISPVSSLVSSLRARSRVQQTAFSDLPANVLGWTPDDVVRWVGRLGLHG